MPSPFPGMDPYLEGNFWTSVHAELGVVIAQQLVPQLRPKYVALPERKYIRGAMEEIMIAKRAIPDVGIRKTRNRGNGPTAGTATSAAPGVKLRTHLATRIPHLRIMIRDVAERRLVTAIELLSPTNKGSGRAAYLRKRQRFLHTSAHLLEIDLHHQGRRIPLDDPYPPGAYYVLLNRARKRAWTEVWAASMSDRLPTVPVPLLKGDADVLLDLQRAFASVYDAGGFDLVVDYRKPPDVELPDEEAEWVNEHLRSCGLRRK